MPSPQKSTKDYSKFIPNAINRVITTDNGYEPRADLVRSMKEIGYSPLCPVICRQVGNKFEIIEGHNRFVAAQFLGIAFHYVVYTDEEIGSMNPLRYSKDQKPWSMRDVFSGYAHEGNDEYAEVVEYCKRTGIPMNVAASMFFCDSAASNARKIVRSGTFRVKDRITPAIVGDLVRHIKLFVPWGATSNLVIALTKCVRAEGFDPKVMKEKIGRHSELLAKRRTNEEYIDMLEEIYNRFHKGNRYPLHMKVDEAMRRRNAVKRKQ